jgi:imidazolonepropionase-like amidohydrolase
MQRVIFSNATVIDVDVGARPNATIAIAGDRIESIDFGRPTPGAVGDVAVFDLGGRSVLPGLINCHYHATYNGVGGGGDVPIGLEAPPGVQVLRGARHLALALDAGFTGVVSGGAPHAIDAALKAAIAEGTIRGPRVMAGSRDVSTTGHSQDLHYPWHWAGEAPSANLADGADSFRRAVRQEFKRGAEIIKIFLTSGHGIPDTELEMELTRDELATAIEAAHQCGIKVRAHMANRGAIMTSVSLGIDVVDHGDGLDEACIELMLQKGTFLVPSMLWPYEVVKLMSGPMADSMKASTEHMLKILPIANKAGVKLLLGDDFGAVPLDHGDYADELDFYVNVAGIPPLDVLRWATRNGAELMSGGREVGALKPGALADMIVVDGDPIADIGVLKGRDKVMAVLKGGAFVKNLLGAPVGLRETMKLTG